MEKILFFFVGVLAAHFVWMGTELLMSTQAILVFPLAYLILLIALAEKFLDEKSGKVDKQVQTDMICVKDQAEQADKFGISDMQSEEGSNMEPNIFDIGKSESCDTEIHSIKDAITEIPEIPNPDMEIAQDLPPKPIVNFVPFPYKEHLPGVKVTRKKLKFLVPTDPNLFRDDLPGIENDKVAQFYLKYIKEKHAEKQLPFFRRKMMKISKRFKKNSQ